MAVRPVTVERMNDIAPVGFADTIVALATAPGRGALAVVRVSGPQARAIASAVVRPWPLEPR